VGPAADVWGLGVVLWEAATGTRAFGNGRDGDVDLPVLHRRADPVRSARRLPTVLADAIDACLEPDPAARPELSGLIAACEALSP
jgi:eukaryotic-like serine/threonine-protein kinase